VTLFAGTLDEWLEQHKEVPVEKVSRDRQRTLNNNAAIRDGRHPVTGFRLLNAGWDRTCGDCDHHFAHRCGKTYHKCELNATRGPQTDIRVSWPACTAFRES
jgi:hypothetical protein